jgi:hypothetical protein
VGLTFRTLGRLVGWRVKPQQNALNQYRLISSFVSF